MATSHRLCAEDVLRQMRDPHGDMLKTLGKTKGSQPPFRFIPIRLAHRANGTQKGGRFLKILQKALENEAKSAFLQGNGCGPLGAYYQQLPWLH